MTRQEFIHANLSQISQVYYGKRNCCRCGCGGDYVATSYMIDPRSEVNDKLVARRLKRAQRLAEDAMTDVECGSNYVDVETGENRTLTFYFDEVKK